MVSAVTVASWPDPDSGKQLQRFLEFANFNHQFICKYSSLAAALKALTSTKVQFQGTSAAKKAFQILKSSFTSAPVLQEPDPKHQFMVEVDVLDVIVGAVLSHQAATDETPLMCLLLPSPVSDRKPHRQWQSETVNREQ